MCLKLRLLCSAYSSLGLPLKCDMGYSSLLLNKTKVFLFYFCILKHFECMRFLRYCLRYPETMLKEKRHLEIGMYIGKNLAIRYISRYRVWETIYCDTVSKPIYWDISYFSNRISFFRKAVINSTPSYQTLAFLDLHLQ